MFIIIGILVVLGAVAGGYLMEHGNLKVLIQPAELLIIGGAAMGTVLIANPLHVLKKIISGVIGALKPSRYNTQLYLDSMKLCYELLNKARREGLLALEGDIEGPEKSPIFQKYPNFLKDHHTRDFVCDTMRMAITGNVDPFDLDQMIEMDMEVSHHEASQPIAALEHDGRFAAGARDRGGSAGGGDYHGRAGWAARGNRAQSGGCAGGYVSGHPAVLRVCGPCRAKYGEGRLMRKMHITRCCACC